MERPPWCPGSRKPPASVVREGPPVDEDGLLLGLVEVIHATFGGGADAVSCVMHALPVQRWLLAAYDIREIADAD